ncbi:MAG: hypothetical protein IPP63_12845 [Chloracidobacterium sp.]|nr:hypothetical protein [Chloracidobacterium sp.]
MAAIAPFAYAVSIRWSICGVVILGECRLRLGNALASVVPTASQSPASNCDLTSREASRMPSNISKDLGVTVNMAFGDLPVVGARISRLAGVTNGNAGFELGNVNVQSLTLYPAGLKWMLATPPYCAE